MRTHNEKIFHIPKVPQYGIIVESPEQVNESIFYEVYQNAAKCVANILASNRLPAHSFPKEKFFNTVISFTGTRGSGKSSAMLTFGNLLKCNNEKIWGQMDVDSNDISKSRFWVLPAIDCTRMGANERLLASVSAKMYQEYQKQSADGKFSYGVTVDQRRNFLTNAQKVNKLAYMFSAGSWYKDESDILQSVADLENIDHSIHELVRSFLSLMFTTQDENSYLVIQIDDLDMNLENSYEIVDEIRKFLMIKNVIVLTSVCMDQLKEVTGLYFNKPLAGKQSGYSNTGDVLAQKYLEKLFPISRQISMPALTTEQLNNYKISNLLGFCDKCDPTTRTELGLDDIAGVPSKMTIFNGVLHLIYRKTLLLLVPERSGRHWIVPNNLRELCNFIYLLQGMKDIAYKKDAQDKYVLRTNEELKNEDVVHTLENNLHSLMMYIVSDMLDYSTAHMHKDTQVMAGVLMRIIHDLPEWTLTTMNKRIVRDILVCAQKTPTYMEFYEEKERDVLIKASAYNYIISMGDVQYVLNVLHKGANNHTIKRFVEYIRVIWSIRMTLEFFCNGVGNCEVIDVSGKIQPKVSIGYENSYESKVAYITKNFRDAVGGMMVNPDMTRFWDKDGILKDIKGIGNVYSKIFETIGIEKIGFFDDLLSVSTKTAEHQTFLKAISVYTLVDHEQVSMAKESGAIASPDYTIEICGADKSGELFITKHDRTQSIADVRFAWRTAGGPQGSGRQPYYRYTPKNESKSRIFYLNPLALFTNLLSPAFLEDGERTGNKYLKWQYTNVMVFPFFSLDWITRFYSDLEKIYDGQEDVKSKEDGNIWEKIERVILSINTTSTRYYLNSSEENGNEKNEDTEVLLTEHSYLNRLAALRKTMKEFTDPFVGSNKGTKNGLSIEKMGDYFKEKIETCISALQDDDTPETINANIFRILNECGFAGDTGKFVTQEIENIEKEEDFLNKVNNKDKAAYLLSQLITNERISKLCKLHKDSETSSTKSPGQ